MKTHSNHDMESFGSKSGRKRKSSPTAPKTQKKQRNESRCPTCSTSGGLVHASSDIVPVNVRRALKDKLASALEDKLTYVLGGGKEETRSNREMNISFMKEYFPNAHQRPYCWPLLFEFKHPSESTADLRDPKGEYSRRDIPYRAWYDQRRGDEAEHKTFHMLSEMLSQNSIASFVISGYDWMRMFPKELLSVHKEVLPRDKIREGESDLLIFLPNKGVLVLEVKSKVETKGKRSLEKVVEKGLGEQCTKAVEFLANSSFDLTAGVNYALIKVMSFPNCPRSDLKNVVCENCSENFITKDDLQSTRKLYKWYDLLLKKYSTQFSASNFDTQLHTGIISRLLGPHLRVKIKTVIHDTHEQIEGEGSLEFNESKWVQLNREQNKVASNNPRFLWLTGDPGSGKTILACWKVEQILRNPSVTKQIIYLIAGNRDMLFIEKMKMLFKSSFVGDESNIELKIEAIDDISDRSPQYELKGLLTVVQKLKKKHQDSDLSIIIDEFRILIQDESEKIIAKLQNMGLKNLWVILNPSSMCPEHSVLIRLGFEVFHLNKVMRMSVPTLDFVNYWLGRSYKIGHSINGLVPKIYRMECICGELPVADVYNCTPILISKLAEQVCRELERTEKRDDGYVEMKDVVIMTKEHAPVKKLLSKRRINVTVRLASYFTGCEGKIVIVDFRHISDKEKTLTEALTRATSRLIIFDVDCAHEKYHCKVSKVKELLDKMQSAKERGLVQMETAQLKETEKEILRYELSLGLFREEDEIKQNVAKVVTVEKLHCALNAQLTPIKEDISNISTALTEIKSALKIS